MTLKLTLPSLSLKYPVHIMSDVPLPKKNLSIVSLLCATEAGRFVSNIQRKLIEEKTLNIGISRQTTICALNKLLLIFLTSHTF